MKYLKVIIGLGAYSPGSPGRELHQFRRGQRSNTRRHCWGDSVLYALLVVLATLAGLCQSGRIVHRQQRQAKTGNR